MRIDENQEIIQSLTTFSDAVQRKLQGFSMFFPRNLLEAGWKYKCIAFYAFYLGLLRFLLPDLSAPSSYTNSALPKAPLLLIWVFFPTSRMTKRYNRNNKDGANNCYNRQLHCIHVYSFSDVWGHPKHFATWRLLLDVLFEILLVVTELLWCRIPQGMKQWQVAVLPVRHLCETICRNEKNGGSSPVASGHVIGERCLNKPFRRCATTAFRPQNTNNFKRNEGKKCNETTLTTATWGARFQQLLHHEVTGWDDLIQGNSCASGLLQLSRSICFPSSGFVLVPRRHFAQRPTGDSSDSSWPNVASGLDRSSH